MIYKVHVPKSKETYSYGIQILHVLFCTNNYHVLNWIFDVNNNNRGWYKGEKPKKVKRIQATFSCFHDHQIVFIL